jgi:protein-S-isoprenylcysteine O-methyltransferase Ste14
MSKDSKNLAWKTLSGFVGLVVILGLVIFVSDWSLKYWEGWIFLCIFSLSSALITVYLWKKDRKLLERRVNAGPGAEKENSQKIIQVFASITFIAVIALPVFDHRLGWSDVPHYMVILGDIIVASGFFLIFLVFRENTFTAATIEVASDQVVITTGPYALVRHPMYTSALIMLFGTPLALGSLWGLFTLIPITLIIIWRLLDEERFLSKNLEGYKEYCQKVRFRLVPFIW